MFCPLILTNIYKSFFLPLSNCLKIVKMLKNYSHNLDTLYVFSSQCHFTNFLYKNITYKIPFLEFLSNKLKLNNE